MVGVLDTRDQLEAATPPKSLWIGYSPNSQRLEYSALRSIPGATMIRSVRSRRMENRIRACVSLVLIGCYPTVACAGPFPDQWVGDLRVKLRMDASAPGMEQTQATDGTLEVTASAGNAVAVGDYSFDHNYEIKPCKAHTTRSFTVRFAGMIKTGPRDSEGLYLDLFPTNEVYQYDETLRCGRLGTRLVGREWTAPTFPNEVPLIDGHEATYAVYGPPLRANGTATFIAPCEGWDSTKVVGPKISMLPYDPRGRDVPPFDPNELPNVSVRFLTDQALDAMNEQDRSEAVARRMLVLGQTSPFRESDFSPVDVRVSTTQPRKRIYSTCVSVDEISVPLPIDRLKTTISAEAREDFSCFQQTAAHEKRHREFAWIALQNIADQLEKQLREQPGKFNARPLAGGAGVETQKQEVESIIEDIVKRELDNLEGQNEHFDFLERSAVDAACGTVRGRIDSTATIAL